MKVEQLKYSAIKGWNTAPLIKDKANLVIVFGSKELLLQRNLLDDIKNMYPNSVQVGCSTAGEIYDIEVSDDILSLVAISFEHTIIKEAIVDITPGEDSLIIGSRLRDQLLANDLSHILVLSDGLLVNGSKLVEGITKDLPKHIAVTGGLAGDGGAFKETVIYANNNSKSARVVAIGFYGTRLKVGYASVGGWDPYGAVRKVTKAEGNVLYELDGQPALDLYKLYLADKAQELPSSALLFPLNIKRTENDEPVVRTVLAIDEDKKSMTFAGDITLGGYARFMKANFNNLVEAAATAANNTGSIKDDADLAILISCVGRKLILKQRIEEEVEAVRDLLGKTVLAGFYSYGEISPFTPNAKCELHNQTMTITTFKEI